MMQFMLKKLGAKNFCNRELTRFSFGLLALLFSSNLVATQTPNIGTVFEYNDYAHDVKTVLLAELYHRLGDSKLGVSQYMRIARVSDDPLIAKRATEIASRSKQPLKGLEMAQRWTKLSPNSLEARQYLALLLLRDQQYKESSKQLHKIIQLVEETSNKKKILTKQPYSKGLKFIGAMLLIESNHDKALLAFDAYSESLDKKHNFKQEENYQAQRYLIRASLAEKAKNHEVTLHAIDKYEAIYKDVDSDLNNYLTDIVKMKLDALQELNQLEKAVSYLTTVIDKKKGSDSLKLELVRILLLNDQRSKAAPYLEDLVDKHPDNNDLLKSLIALQIDQKEFSNAHENITKLKMSQEYANDAKYFVAELFEAQGNLELALKNYNEVTGGKLLANAKKKVNHLTMLLNKKLQSNVNYMKYNKKDKY